jgi:hypothetical protein
VSTWYYDGVDPIAHTDLAEVIILYLEVLMAKFVLLNHTTLR